MSLNVMSITVERAIITFNLFVFPLFFMVGCSVLYLMFLSFALFLNRDEFRQILFFLDPGLKEAGPDTKVRYTCSFFVEWSTRQA